MTCLFVVLRLERAVSNESRERWVILLGGDKCRARLAQAAGAWTRLGDKWPNPMRSLLMRFLHCLGVDVCQHEKHLDSV